MSNTTNNFQKISFRVGNAYDVHGFCKGDKIKLLGVEIKHCRGFKAHSDGDVAMHALTDALLGALCKGDIGQHFPPNNDKWKDCNSEVFLKYAFNLLQKQNGEISNIDITIVAEMPKIAPHSTKMRENIARILNLQTNQVSVKATTSEKLGFIGKCEGIAAHATILIMIEN